MMAVSDGVVIGIVLGLVFAAVSYYLYSRMGQLERKVGMMENILLDLKVTTEQTLLSATEDTPDLSSDVATASDTIPEMTSYSELTENTTKADARELTVEAPRTRTPPQTPVLVEREQTEVPKSSASVTSISVNYESMTYKELVQLARQKGISGTRTMSKAQVIEALRGVDGGTSPSSSSGPAPLSSWTLNDTDGAIGSMSDMNDGLLATLDDPPEASLVSSD